MRIYHIYVVHNMFDLFMNAFDILEINFKKILLDIIQLS